MIPLRDVIPSRTTPFVTIALIGVNAAVFACELWLDEPRLDALILAFGLVPAAFSWVTVFTSMFLHGGLLHVGANMLYLWIFGDNVEDRMGHGRFLTFYLLCGVAAALAQTFAVPSSTIPMVGSSGAIGGVMGAYFVLYPYSRIVTVLPVIVFFQIVEVPAIFFLAIWVLIQFASTAGAVATITGGGNPQGGMALWAHLAGFAAGISSVIVFRRPERLRVEWWNDRP